MLEEWMTPDLFAGTGAHDEFTFMQTPGARAKLRAHQRSWIQEADFRWMKDHGLNAVRIPVGYWILEGDAPYVASIGRLDWAMKMCAKYDLKALICLHGAPGSQNGHDHSGKRGSVLWHKSALYRTQTIECLKQLAHRYAAHAALWGIELLNEPRPGLIQWKLRRFYSQAFRQLAAIVPSTVRIVYSDAFTPRLMADAIGSNDRRTVMDVHWYHFVTWGFLPLRPYFVLVTLHGHLLRRLSRRQPVIVGEWSGVLSGKILGRYVVTQHAAIIRDYIARQLIAYEPAEGWFYWSYKTSASGVWNFRSLVEDGTIDLTK